LSKIVRIQSFTNGLECRNFLQHNNRRVLKFDNQNTQEGSKEVEFLNKKTGVESMAKNQRLNSHLSDKQISLLKDKLLATKEDILNKISDQTQYALDPNEQKEQVDAANNNREKEQEARLLSRQGFLVKKITKALHDIEKGEYGLCKDCDVDIPFERLKARPVAEMCITCKEDSEKEEGGKLYKRRSRSFGKTVQEMGKF